MHWDPTDAFIGSCDVPQQLLKPWCPPLQCDYGYLGILDCTRIALEKCKYGWPPIVSKLNLHVDGSYSPTDGAAAWSIIVMPIEQNACIHYAGHYSANVSVTPFSGDYLGAVTTSSNTADTHGFVWALSYMRCSFRGF